MYDNWLPPWPMEYVEWFVCGCGKRYRRLRSIRKHCNELTWWSGNPVMHQPGWVLGAYNVDVAGRFR